ncbi:MAG: tetratricopeptide repeat protein [Anaerolineaceae bacterium]|nr:tetratricopeptide repeat protein [Anaerolineaceae bacterium]
MDKIIPSASEINQMGQTSFRNGNFAAAAQSFQEAARLYSESGDALMAAEVANNCSVAFLKNGDPQQALDLAQGTDEIFAGAGDTYRQGLSFGNQAAAWETLGRYEEALICYQRSSELLKNHPDHDTRAAVLQNLSALQMRMGKQMEAMATMDTALDNKSRLSLKERFLKKLLRIPFRMLGSKE